MSDKSSSKHKKGPKTTDEVHTTKFFNFKSHLPKMRSKKHSGSFKSKKKKDEQPFLDDTKWETEGEFLETVNVTLCNTQYQVELEKTQSNTFAFEEDLIDFVDDTNINDYMPDSPLNLNGSTEKKKNISRRYSTASLFKGLFRGSKSLDHEMGEKRDYDNEGSKSKSSIRRKISHIMGSSGSLSRSFSVRDLQKKNKPKTESKNSMWSTSLQSLVENDIVASCNDFSYLNYDVMNNYSYEDSCEEFRQKSLLRTQSMVMQKVNSNDPIRHSVATDIPYEAYINSTHDLSFQTEAASLPALHHLALGNVSPETNRKYQRRSVSSAAEDAADTTEKVSSFRSSCGRCSKLKRQNACRQVRRSALQLSTLGSTADAITDNVRSRSLNHLDSLEPTLQRQCPAPDGDGCAPSAGALPTEEQSVPLKDSRSEPDCAAMSRPPDRHLTVPPPDSPTPPDRARLSATGRRQMLSRSQVSSSEYFGVCFDLSEDASVIHGKEEFLPATKGTILSEALAKVCERRSIDLNNCDIYLEGCRVTNYILHQETSAFGGKTLRITQKDSSNKKNASSHQGTTSRKYTGSCRGKSSFFSSSTEDSSLLSGSTLHLLQDCKAELDQNKKQSKQRWSAFFSNNKDTRMECLSEQLNHYAIHGVPKMHHATQIPDDVVEALYDIEEDWRLLIDLSELTERQQQQQTAIWELITTEVAYIRTLRVVTGLFVACLQSLQSNSILTEIDTDKLFSNIADILECNLAFWGDCLLPAVRGARATRHPISPYVLQDGFLRMRDTYHPYFRYCAEQARCQHYCRDNHAHNETFTAYLVWCETQKECNRLRLMDILVRPMQRLTKYGLLLKAIYKNTDDFLEKECLHKMIKSVDDFVNSVNSSLRQKQDSERLQGIIARIESYDAVDTKDDDLQVLVQKYNQLDLSQPMPGCPADRKRHLLLEGDLKLKDGLTSKMEVHCFLLTDVLLVCKPSSKKGSSTMRVVRPPFLVDRLVVAELNRETPSLGLVYLNEFRTASQAFILQNNDAKRIKGWVDNIRKAQSLYEQARHAPSVGLFRQPSSAPAADDLLEPELGLEYAADADMHSLQSLLPSRSPMATSSRASRVSSLAHSHSGSVEMNDQSSLGSANNQSRAVSMENDNRTASISSDEGVQPLPAEKAGLKQRLFNTSPKTLTPNTLSVEPYGSLGQSLPNLTLASPSPNHHNTLLVPGAKAPHPHQHQQLLSPNHRGISYPPPSPTRANLRRGFAISQTKNPPLLKTGHVNSTVTAACTPHHQPASFDLDVPVIAGISRPDDMSESFSRGQHRQAMMKRVSRADNRRYHTAGVVDDIKRDNKRDPNILKRLSWNYGPTDQTPAFTNNTHRPEDHTT